jgi:hypothetical protein
VVHPAEFLQVSLHPSQLRLLAKAAQQIAKASEEIGSGFAGRGIQRLLVELLELRS